MAPSVLGIGSCTVQEDVASSLRYVAAQLSMLRRSTSCCHSSPCFACDCQEPRGVPSSLIVVLPEAAAELIGVLTSAAKDANVAINGASPEVVKTAEEAAVSNALRRRIADSGRRRETNTRKQSPAVVRVGMRLEARDRQNPTLTCVANVVEVNGTIVTINFDGWTDRYNYRYSPGCQPCPLHCQHRHSELPVPVFPVICRAPRA